MAMQKLLSFRKFLYPSPGQYKKADWLCMGFLSFLFSFSMVFGESFYLEGSWNMVLGSSETILKSTLKGIGYFVFFFLCFYIGWHFVAYPKAMIQDESSKFRILRWIDDHPFLSTWVCFLVLYLPYFIAFYPGIMMGDTGDMIAQGYNLPENSSNHLNMLDPNVTLNQHHPVIYTLFIHICMVVGHAIFHDWNAALFVATALQTCIIISVYGFCISELKSLGVARKWRLMVLIYFLFAPGVRNWIFVLTKDVLYATMLLLFIICFYRVIRQDYKQYHIVYMTVACVFSLLFRHDGKYLFSIVFLVTAICKRECRKRCIPAIPLILIGMHLYSSVFLPSFGITPGSRRELLSIPFQQTARYLGSVPDEEITDEERSAISAILDYDLIKEKYEAEKSDNVKNTFNESATPEQMKEYFRVWYAMFRKHPGIYIQATMNNAYDYFYPGELAGCYTSSSSQMNIDSVNKNYPSMKFDFHYNSLAGLRKLLECYDIFFVFPITSLLLTPAFFTWSVLICGLVSLRRRNWDTLCVWLPLLMVILICVASPVNGWYFRYLYPVGVALPVVFALHVLSLGRQHDEAEKVAPN